MYGYAKKMHYYASFLEEYRVTVFLQCITYEIYEGFLLIYNKIIYIIKCVMHMQCNIEDINCKNKNYM